MKPCKSDQIRNPKTNRCVKKSGRIGRSINRSPRRRTSRRRTSRRISPRRRTSRRKSPRRKSPRRKSRRGTKPISEYINKLYEDEFWDPKIQETKKKLVEQAVQEGIRRAMLKKPLRIRENYIITQIWCKENLRMEQSIEEKISFLLRPTKQDIKTIIEREYVWMTERVLREATKQGMTKPRAILLIRLRQQMNYKKLCHGYK